MGQRLGRQSNDQTVHPCVVDKHTGHDNSQSDSTLSRQSIAPSAVIIKIQLLKMESNNLNGNGNDGAMIVDQSTSSSTTLAVDQQLQQLALRSTDHQPTITSINAVPASLTNLNHLDYLPMAATANNNSENSSNNLNRCNNLSRCLANSESDNTLSSSNPNNNTASTFNIVCDNSKINNLSISNQMHHQQQQQNQMNFNITNNEPSREIYTMMYAASNNVNNTASSNNVQDEDAVLSNASDPCNHCSRRRTLAALARRSRVCKLCHESLDDTNVGSKPKDNCKPSKDKDAAKPKKGNWGIKFNCAKLRGSSKASSSAAANVAPILQSQSVPVSDCNASLCSSVPPSSTGYTVPSAENARADSCICTGYRKVDDSESEKSENEYDVRLPQHPAATKTTTTSVSLFSTTTTTGPAGTTSRTSTFLLPEHTTTTTLPQNIAQGPTSVSPLTTTSTTTTLLHANGQLIQRIERTTAALYGNNPSVGTNSVILVSMNHNPPLIDIARFNADDFPIEDCDERARIQRALEIAEGVEPPPGFTPSPTTATAMASALIPSSIAVPAAPMGYKNPTNAQWHSLMSSDTVQDFMQRQMPNIVQEEMPRIHSQVDYIHCLVPDLQKITGCCFYWGKMDRYEAEKLLEGKPEGTFLLRDSAQEDFLFSVSFRKYGRSLHARIEQFNHKFSFDSHDPGVYTASTVTGLLEHYKDPSCVMFFEPMLTLPLNRNFCFSLQQLCRANVVSHITYDGINELCLPQRLRMYLQEYHYKQRVRVRRCDDANIYAKTS